MNKIWERIFGKRQVKKEEVVLPVVNSEENILKPKHDYGLLNAAIILSSQDYGWQNFFDTSKKIILINPLECKDKINFMTLLSCWRGTGHTEWEALLAIWFIEAVLEAIENDVNEADITHMFTRDLIASNNRVFKRGQVYEHLKKWFDIIDDTPGIVKLRLHIE